MPTLTELAEITVGCLVDGVPSPGTWVHVHIGTVKKNPFAGTCGPTDHRGLLTISGKELLRQAETSLSFSAMDHGSPHTDLSGEISVEPMTRSMTVAALAAADTYPDDAYAPGYRSVMTDLLATLEAMSGSKILAQVISVNPTGVFTVTAPHTPIPIC